MNDVLLIHRIIPKENPETKHPMTFITGEMEETRWDDLLDLLSRLENLSLSDVILKYNGFTVELKAEDIPELLKQVLIGGYPIYEVYELYDQ